MSHGKRNFILVCSLVLVFVSIVGCLPGKQGPVSFSCAPLMSKIQSLLPKPKAASSTQASSSTSGSSTVPGPGNGITRPHPPVRTGDITTGTKTQIATQVVDSSGGTISVNKPGDPLDGFAINVPAQAYSESHTFNVSSAPITNQSFGTDITPVSPMITVENGGGYSDELMYIRVPVKVPDDSVAMGFIYDDKTKQLEGLPLAGKDVDSVTIATRHFCTFFISMIKNIFLKNDIDSGFRPGIDDWQFVNYGSYIAPGGHCEGQSLSAMWYYCTQPDGKDLCLYNRYDNNGNKPATPDLWQDDSLGYRFASVIQTEKHAALSDAFWDNLAGVGWEKINNKLQIKHIPGIGDEYILNLFAYSILVTHEPQEVGICSNAGGGHAMIAYKIVDNALYVADPNYPANKNTEVRKIIFDSKNGKFEPYNSGANKKEIDAGYGHAFENIQYLAKSTVVPWDAIAQHWAEFKNGTIGNDKFPICRVQYKDDQGKYHDVPDGFVSSTKLLDLYPESNPHVNDLSFRQYRDGVVLTPDKNGMTELKPGNNRLGCCFFREVQKTGADGKPYTAEEYIDFKYINIVFNSLTIDPPSLNGEPNKDYTFTAKVDNPPSQAKYEWSVDGKQVQSSPSTSFKTKFPDTKPYTIAVDLLDSSGKEIATATASATITSAANSNNAATSGKQNNLNIFQTLFVAGQLSAVMRGNLTASNINGVKTTTRDEGIPLQAKFDNITWSGTTFSSEQTSSQDSNGVSWSLTRTVKGQVSSDGMNIESLVLSENSKNSTGAYRNLTVTLSNLPLKYVGVQYGRTALFNAYDAATINPHLNIVYEYKDLSKGRDWWSEVHTMQSLGQVAQLSVAFSNPR